FGRGTGLRYQLFRGLWVLGDDLLSQPQLHSERHEPRLCSIVQIALDSSKLCGRVVDRFGPRLRHLAHPTLQCLTALLVEEQRISVKAASYDYWGGDPPSNEHWQRHHQEATCRPDSCADQHHVRERRNQGRWSQPAQT